MTTFFQNVFFDVFQQIDFVILLTQHFKALNIALNAAQNIRIGHRDQMIMLTMIHDIHDTYKIK